MKSLSNALFGDKVSSETDLTLEDNMDYSSVNSLPGQCHGELAHSDVSQTYSDESNSSKLAALMDGDKTSETPEPTSPLATVESGSLHVYDSELEIPQEPGEALCQTSQDDLGRASCPEEKQQANIQAPVQRCDLDVDEKAELMSEESRVFEEDVKSFIAEARKRRDAKRINRVRQRKKFWKIYLEIMKKIKNTKKKKTAKKKGMKGHAFYSATATHGTDAPSLPPVAASLLSPRPSTSCLPSPAAVPGPSAIPSPPSFSSHSPFSSNCLLPAHVPAPPPPVTALLHSRPITSSLPPSAPLPPRAHSSIKHHTIDTHPQVAASGNLIEGKSSSVTVPRASSFANPKERVVEPRCIVVGERPSPPRLAEKIMDPKRLPNILRKSKAITENPITRQRFFPRLEPPQQCLTGRSNASRLHRRPIRQKSMQQPAVLVLPSNTEIAFGDIVTSFRPFERYSAEIAASDSEGDDSKWKEEVVAKTVDDVMRDFDPSMFASRKEYVRSLVVAKVDALIKSNHDLLWHHQQRVQVAPKAVSWSPLSDNDRRRLCDGSNGAPILSSTHQVVEPETSFYKDTNQDDALPSDEVNREIPDAAVQATFPAKHVPFQQSTDPPSVILANPGLTPAFHQQSCTSTASTNKISLKESTPLLDELTDHVIESAGERTYSAACVDTGQSDPGTMQTSAAMEDSSSLLQSLRPGRNEPCHNATSTAAPAPDGDSDSDCVLVEGEKPDPIVITSDEEEEASPEKRFAVKVERAINEALLDTSGESALEEDDSIDDLFNNYQRMENLEDDESDSHYDVISDDSDSDQLRCSPVVRRRLDVRRDLQSASFSQCKAEHETGLRSGKTVSLNDEKSIAIASKVIARLQKAPVSSKALQIATSSAPKGNKRVVSIPTSVIQENSQFQRVIPLQEEGKLARNAQSTLVPVKSLRQIEGAIKTKISGVFPRSKVRPESACEPVAGPARRVPLTQMAREDRPRVAVTRIMGKKGQNFLKFKHLPSAVVSDSFKNSSVVLPMSACDRRISERANIHVWDGPDREIESDEERSEIQGSVERMEADTNQWRIAGVRSLKRVPVSDVGVQRPSPCTTTGLRRPGVRIEGPRGDTRKLLPRVCSDQHTPLQLKRTFDLKARLPSRASSADSPSDVGPPLANQTTTKQATSKSVKEPPRVLIPRDALTEDPLASPSPVELPEVEAASMYSPPPLGYNDETLPFRSDKIKWKNIRYYPSKQMFNTILRVWLRIGKRPPPGCKLYYRKDGRPPFSYVELCALALESTRWKSLRSIEIVDFVQTHFGFFKKAPFGSWQVIIRKQLSHSSVFRSDRLGGITYYTFSDCFKLPDDPDIFEKSDNYTENSADEVPEADVNPLIPLCAYSDDEAEETVEKQNVHAVFETNEPVIPPRTPGRDLPDVESSSYPRRLRCSYCCIDFTDVQTALAHATSHKEMDKLCPACDFNSPDLLQLTWHVNANHL